LAALRLVPLYERLSLWVVPALYFGLALFADGAARLGRTAYLRRSWTRAVLAVAIMLVSLQLCADVFRRGKADLEISRPTNSNHELDDRAAVKWLMEQRQPGDVVMATTSLALPAVWWYGGIPISDAAFAGARPDGGPLFVVGYNSPRAACPYDELSATLEGQRRVLVYLGFGSDTPRGFADLLLYSLGQLGAMTTRAFAELGRVAVVDLIDRPAPEGTLDGQQQVASADLLAMDICLTVRPARRW
jgi:hypothetical protein